MKVLFLTLAEFSKFPAYKRAIGMGEAMALMGDTVYVAALDCDENRSRMRREAPGCIPIWFKKGGLINEIVSKLMAVWKIHPNVVYSTSYSVRNLAFLGWALPKGTIKVLEFSELYSLYGDTKKLWKIKERIAVMENNYLVCASVYIYNYFHDLLGRMRKKRSILYLPYAYPAYLVVHTPHDKEKNHKRIVFMAALFANYGVYDVVDSCSALLRNRTDVFLDIIGDGPERKNLIEHLQKMNLSHKVCVHGFVAEEALSDLFSDAAIFIAPMKNTVQDEARCPSKVYYYIPYNKPIITCRIGEPFIALGCHGYYYSPNNMLEMADQVLKGLDESMSFSYPKGFVGSHSWQSRATKFRDCILQGGAL